MVDERKYTEGQKGQQRPQRRPARSSRSRKMRNTVMRGRSIGIAAFGIIMVLGCLVGLLFFARPAISDYENRELTKFPAFSMESFLNGSFFTDVSLWYADTYPLREPMVQASQNMKNLFGVVPDTRMIGGNRTSDELPPEGEPAEATPLPTHEHNVDEPTLRKAAEGIEEQIKDGVYVKDGACYTLYYFSKQAVQDYAAVINDAASMLPDDVNVYSILIPTNAGVLLGEEELTSLGVPDQEQVIKYFYSLMNDDIVTVPTYNALRDHNDEYIFFRTDFHWTQLGSYYVYLSFCEQKGIDPAPFFDWELKVFEPFRGEYSEVTDISSFQPDAVEARTPQGTNEMLYWHDDSNMSKETGEPGEVVADFTDSADDDPDKYNCFVCGNQAVSYVENPKVTDGSSCLIVKDSFGNPLMATMVDNYQYIWALDFRFTNQKLLDMVKKYGIKDVIFENTIMFAGTNNCVNLLSNIVYPDDEPVSDSAASASSSSASSN